MTLACDTIFRGNLGNKFPWILQNFFRAPSSPCSARVPFRYYNQYMLAFIKNASFFSAATTPHKSFPNAPHHRIAVLLLHAIFILPAFTSISLPHQPTHLYPSSTNLICRANKCGRWRFNFGPPIWNLYVMLMSNKIFVGSVRLGCHEKCLRSNDRREAGRHDDQGEGVARLQALADKEASVMQAQVCIASKLVEGWM
jgi:hypothetical protein